MDTTTLRQSARIPEELLRNASSLHLAVHVHPGGVLFAVFNPEEGQFPFIQALQVDAIHPEPFADIVQVVSSFDWIRTVFRRATLSFDTPDFALVPSGLIQPGKEAGFLSFHARPYSGKILTNTLPESGITIVSDAPKSVQALARTIPGAQLQPSCGLFLRFVFAHHARNQNEVHLLLESGYMLMTIMVAGAHHLTNHFDVQGEEDVLYFVAHSALRLGVDLEHAHIHLYGPSVSVSVQHLLSAYCRNIHKWKAPVAFRLPENTEALPFFSVVIHPICAS